MTPSDVTFTFGALCGAVIALMLRILLDVFVTEPLRRRHEQRLRARSREDETHK